MSEKIKVIFIQMLMIATGIVAVMSIEGIVYHLNNDTYVLEWYHPVSILIAAFLCSIPSLLLSGYEQWPLRKIILGIITHCLVLYLIIIGMGYVFRWFTVLSGFLLLTIGYLLVYIFVWAGTMWICKRDAKIINDALSYIRDEE